MCHTVNRLLVDPDTKKTVLAKSHMIARRLKNVEVQRQTTTVVKAIRETQFSMFPCLLEQTNFVDGSGLAVANKFEENVQRLLIQTRLTFPPQRSDPLATPPSEICGRR